MQYTAEQKALISAMIGAKIAPRTRSASLRQALVEANENMYADKLTESDLLLINSALELLLPSSPTDENKEEYRELVEAFVVTRKLLAEIGESGAE